MSITFDPDLDTVLVVAMTLKSGLRISHVIMMDDELDADGEYFDPETKIEVTLAKESDVDQFWIVANHDEEEHLFPDEGPYSYEEAIAMVRLRFRKS